MLDSPFWEALSHEPPSRLAILGAGAAGIEAALYARFLGYQVQLFEAHSVGHHWLHAPNAELLETWPEATTRLGVQAIQAQEAHWKLPGPLVRPTAKEFVDAYLRPLAASDLLSDCLQEGVQVLSVTRGDSSKREPLAWAERRAQPFLLRVKQGVDLVWHEADVVFDATGTWRSPAACGIGGTELVTNELPAQRIHCGLLDPLHDLPQQPEHWMLLGAGLTAACNLLTLAKWTQTLPGLRVTWVVRREGTPGENFPVPQIMRDSQSSPVSGRIQQLSAQANQLAQAALAGQSAWLQFISGQSLLELGDEKQSEQRLPESFAAKLQGETNLLLKGVNHLVASTGYRPQLNHCRELQLAFSRTSECPLSIAEFPSQAEDDPYGVSEHPQVGTYLNCVLTEPDYYLLGDVRAGRLGGVTLPELHSQLVTHFALLRGREALNLYR